MLLPDTGLDGAFTVAENLRAALQAMAVPGLDRAVTGSFGVAVHPEDAADAETLLRRADQALYLGQAQRAQPGRGGGRGADRLTFGVGSAPAMERRAEFTPQMGLPDARHDRCRRRRAPRRDRAQAPHARRRRAGGRAGRADRARPGADRRARRRRRTACDEAIDRTRFWLGLDDDLDGVPRPLPRRPDHRARRPARSRGCARRAGPSRSRRSPGRSPSSSSTSRARRRSSGGSSSGSAARCERTGLRDVPSARKLAAPGARVPPVPRPLGGPVDRAGAGARGRSPPGRVDLRAPDHEAGWRRLRTIPGIGSWTLEILALHGQGRHDQVPAGDLNFLKLVARMRTGSPHARATEDEVREFFAPYAPWSGLAGVYAMRSPVLTGPPRPADPRRGRTRSSARAADPLAA